MTQACVLFIIYMVLCIVSSDTPNESSILHMKQHGEDSLGHKNKKDEGKKIDTLKNEVNGKKFCAPLVKIKSKSVPLLPT